MLVWFLFFQITNYSLDSLKPSTSDPLKPFLIGSTSRRAAWISYTDSEYMKSIQNQKFLWCRQRHTFNGRRTRQWVQYASTLSCMPQEKDGKWPPQWLNLRFLPIFHYFFRSIQVGSVSLVPGGITNFFSETFSKNSINFFEPKKNSPENFFGFNFFFQKFGSFPPLAFFFAKDF